MKVSVKELRVAVLRRLAELGYDDSEQAVISDVLLYAQLRGNNQGIVKLLGEYFRKRPAQGDIEVVHESATSAMLDGKQQQGMMVMTRVVDICRQKTASSGVCVVGVRNTSTSTGAIGYWAQKMADAGLVCFVFAGSMPAVAPHRSCTRLMGTNPLAVGIPSSGDPVVLDMATSAISYFGVVEAKTAGEKLPEGVAYDQDGRPCDDPATVLEEGCIRPFAAHKGSGLSLMIEALTGPLVKACFAGVGDVNNWGNLIIAFQPETLGTAQHELRNGMSQLAGKVHTAKPIPSASSSSSTPLLPGERGNAATATCKREGSVEIDDSLWHGLQSAQGQAKATL